MIALLLFAALCAIATTVDVSEGFALAEKLVGIDQIPDSVWKSEKELKAFLAKKFVKPPQISQDFSQDLQRPGTNYVQLNLIKREIMLPIYSRKYGLTTNEMRELLTKLEIGDRDEIARAKVMVARMEILDLLFHFNDGLYKSEMNAWKNWIGQEENRELAKSGNHEKLDPICQELFGGAISGQEVINWCNDSVKDWNDRFFWKLNLIKKSLAKKSKKKVKELDAIIKKMESDDQKEMEKGNMEMKELIQNAMKPATKKDDISLPHSRNDESSAQRVVPFVITFAVILLVLN